MNRNSTIAAGLIALAAVAAHAETPDPSGQFAHNPGSTASRAAVQADYQAHRQEVAAFTREDSGSAYVAPRFESTKTRAQVRNEFLASRTEVEAMNGEDSGSTYLAARRVQDGGRMLAGTPVKAQ